MGRTETTRPGSRGARPERMKGSGRRYSRRTVKGPWKHENPAPGRVGHTCGAPQKRATAHGSPTRVRTDRLGAGGAREGVSRGWPRSCQVPERPWATDRLTWSGRSSGVAATVPTRSHFIGVSTSSMGWTCPGHGPFEPEKVLVTFPDSVFHAALDHELVLAPGLVGTRHVLPLSVGEGPSLCSTTSALRALSSHPPHPATNKTPRDRTMRFLAPDTEILTTDHNLSGGRRKKSRRHRP